jgi:hypothetical protein
VFRTMPSSRGLGHCDASAAGAMGAYSSKAALIQIQTQVLDPLQPEVLVYLPKKNGDVKRPGASASGRTQPSQHRSSYAYIGRRSLNANQPRTTR